jgi:hypothetical protein
VVSLNSSQQAEPDARHRHGAEAPRVVVAVAAHDPPAAIGPVLLALAAQSGPAGLPIAPGAFGVALALGPGCTRLGALARALAPKLPFPLLVQEMPLPAGSLRPFWSRRRALELAAAWQHGSGHDDATLLLTDGAARPSPFWLWSMLAGLDGRTEAVAGAMAETRQPDPQAERLARLGALLDPHPDARLSLAGALCDANLALRLATWRRLPALPPGPGDGALIAALRQADVRLRHLPDALLALSGHAAAPPPPEALGSAWRRLRLTATLRRLWASGTGTLSPETPELRRLAGRLGLPPGALAQRLTARHFGRLMAGLEQECAALRRVAGRPSWMEAAATTVLLALLQLEGLRPSSSPAGGW